MWLFNFKFAHIVNTALLLTTLIAAPSAIVQALKGKRKALEVCTKIAGIPGNPSKRFRLTNNIKFNVLVDGRAEPTEVVFIQNVTINNDVPIGSTI